MLSKVDALKRTVRVALALSVCAVWSVAAAGAAEQEKGQIRKVEINEPGGQILSFPHLVGSTLVVMKGTRIEPQATAKMKIGSRRGFVRIDINKGDIKGIQPARRFGEDFLTYVLWAVSVDGSAMNLGEITFDKKKPVGINVTTPWQTFWLMITAEPDYAVTQPSSVVVLISQNQNGLQTDLKALPVPGKLFYYTHYSGYSTQPGPIALKLPNEIIQGRMAIKLASKAGVLGSASAGSKDLEEVAGIRQTLERAKGYLRQAEKTHSVGGDPKEVIQFARTAVQVAENARALALGAVGGISVRLLELDLENKEKEVVAAKKQFRDYKTRVAGQLKEAEAARKRAAEAEQAAQRRVEAAERAAQEKIQNASSATGDAQKNTNQLRQQLTSLEATYQQSMKAARGRITELRKEREAICGELRRQLGSLGQLTEHGNDMVLTLASDVLFDLGSYALRPISRESLAKVAVLRLLLFPEANVRYEGHTDLVGENDFNHWLSEQRALAVYEYFLEEELSHSTKSRAIRDIEVKISAVERLLKMKFKRGSNPRRKSLMAQLGDRVVGRGERDPVENISGPSELNRRVTLLFPPAQMGQFSSRCQAPAEEDSNLLSGGKSKTGY